MAMRFKHPVELLSELEERCARSSSWCATRARDRVVLDVDADVARAEPAAVALATRIR